jgi:hypothetical protein
MPVGSRVKRGRRAARRGSPGNPAVCKLTHTHLALLAVQAVDVKERMMSDERFLWLEYHEWFVTLAGITLMGLAVWLA